MSEENVTPQVSPSPATQKLEGADFPTAIRWVIEGRKITKGEWKNDKVYGYWNKNINHLMIHLMDDDKDHDWIISDGDLLGNDWKEVKTNE